MCGIYGFVAARDADGIDLGGFIDRCRGLVAEPAGAQAAAIAADSAALVSPRTFHELWSKPDLRDELDQVVGDLAAWIADLEQRIEHDRALDSGEVERLNVTLTAARDLHWRLRRDVLSSLEQVVALVRLAIDASDVPHSTQATLASAFAVAWRLHLCFNAIDRLEVRGRDSAGLSLQLHFPAAEAVDGIIASLDGADRARVGDPRLGHLAVVRPEDAARASLVFIYKVAEEVGKIGDNVRTLRAAVAGDRLLWQLLVQPGVDAQILAHTRWASNGIISIPNCHPIDGAVEDHGALVGGGRVLAVLNGDVDNYPDLRARYAADGIDPAITTDAKIIPVLVERYYRESGDLGAAFRRAFHQFEGSVAIAVVASDRPGEILLGQKGSGQGLYLGRAGAGVGISSELYGLVELTADYMKLEGERMDAAGAVVGEVVRVRRSDDGVVIEALTDGQVQPMAESRFATAGITTRDIDRGEHEHFMAKEIGESVATVRKTLRGRFDLIDGRVEFRLGPDAVPPQVIADLRTGVIGRILCIGQGTAAIAAEGVRHLLSQGLVGLDVDIDSMRATELSGHHLRADMADTLVIAVSQSGTTTDTNRTVDMVRARGARVLAIVNRRNSDLVFRADGVIYTSDGRDVEMSVASTKAFYAQNVAGRVLSLYLASELETLSRDELVREIEALQALPDLMQRMLLQSPTIAAIAARYAPRRRHWAVVGSGAGRVAADEIRIKLSELCYKSIAVDYLEDKKHIDLSSEPLVLICAAGLPAGNVSDVVKEVAIFRAHRSLPVVITEESEDRFDRYAECVIRVPAYRDDMAYLLATMAGHLFGYHAARAFDAQAGRLRRIRNRLVSAGESPDHASSGLQEVVGPVAQDLLDLGDELSAGHLDSCLEVGTAVRLATVADLLLSRLPISILRQRFHLQPTVGHVLDLAIEVLSTAINEVARPIDAIKHQAKTVTVGISRSELRPTGGLLWQPLQAAGVDLGTVDESVMSFLNAFEPLVATVTGVTRYAIDGLDPLGRPTPDTTIRVIAKTGIAAGLTSRADRGAPLTGAKWVAVKDRVLYLGTGQADGRRILLIPLPVNGGFELFLYHLELGERGERSQRMAALRGLMRRHDRLIASVTERNLAWTPELIDHVDNEDLLFTHVDDTAAKIIAAAG